VPLNEADLADAQVLKAWHRSTSGSCRDQAAGPYGRLEWAVNSGIVARKPCIATSRPDPSGGRGCSWGAAGYPLGFGVLIRIAPLAPIVAITIWRLLPAAVVTRRLRPPAGPRPCHRQTQWPCINRATRLG
jgi:hypothetical protein